MDIPHPGGGHGRGGHEGGGDLRWNPSEHFRWIYTDKARYGPVFGGGVAPRSAGFEAVVGTGGTRSGGYTEGGAGNGGWERLGVAGGRGGGGQEGYWKLTKKMIL